ncbi:MAG: hypothetical protein C4547_09660 [Phycisphaerales bacterium]|nr:MAG: hypothetical protein C4547_09660 [Phycisphaerales bacterium]
MRIDERFLAFEFSDLWQVIKYDESVQHTQRMQLLDSKGVDVVALHPNLIMFLEIKDFRGRRIENKYKFGGSLARTVAQKVRDSVAGVVGQVGVDSSPSTWTATAKSLIDRRANVIVVLFVEQELRESVNRRKARMTVEGGLLKRHLRWLAARSLVVDRDTYCDLLPDIQVMSLPGAAGMSGGGKE